MKTHAQSLHTTDDGLDVPNLENHAFRRNERGADAFMHASRHSRRVRWLKFLLPALGLAVMGGFVAYSYYPFGDTGDASAFQVGEGIIDSGELVMANPTLEGFTASNQPYAITAKRARQPIGEPLGAFSLEEIRARIPFGDTDTAEISANAGHLDREKNKLLLNKTISIETTSGIKANLESAEIDLLTKSVDSTEPVRIEMKGMRIGADRFSAQENGETLVFDGNVQLEIQPSEVNRQSDGNKEAGE